MSLGSPCSCSIPFITSLTPMYVYTMARSILYFLGDVLWAIIGPIWASIMLAIPRVRNAVRLNHPKV